MFEACRAHPYHSHPLPRGGSCRRSHRTVRLRRQLSVRLRACGFPFPGHCRRRYRRLEPPAQRGPGVGLDSGTVGRTDFAYVKATEGTDYVNPNWLGDINPARLTGIRGGNYHFARPSDAPDIPGGWKTWTIWQTTSTWDAPGVEGPVDRNVFNGNVQGLDRLLG